MDSPRDASEFVLSLQDEAAWRTFGMHLRITQAVIRRMEQKPHCSEVDDYFAEIYYYLERSDRKPTWHDIACALEKSGNILLAKKIRREHGNPVESSLNWRRETGEKCIGLQEQVPLTTDHHISQKFLKLVDRYIALLHDLKEAIFRPTDYPQILIDNLQFILKNKCGWEPIQGETLNDVFDRLNDRLACHNHEVFEMVLKICFPKKEQKLSKELKCFKKDYESFKKSTKLKKLTKLMSDCAASNENRRVKVKVGRNWECNDMKKFERLLNEIMESVNYFNGIEVVEGCVNISWEVSQEGVSQIVKSLARSNDFMKAVGVFYLKVAGEEVYKIADQDQSRDEEPSIETCFVCAVKAGQMEAACVLLSVSNDPFSLMNSEEVSKEEFGKLQDSKGWSLLHFACSRGYVDIVDVLCGKYFDPDVPDNNGWTPLMVAINDFQIEVTTVMIAKKVNVNHSNADGTTPVYIAAQTRQVEAVYDLLNAGADPHMAKKNGMTPLMIASKNGSSDTVTLLIGEEIGLDLVNEKGMTALNFASTDGHSDVVSLLIQSGANPEIPNDRGYTPLMSASEKGFSKVVEILLPKVNVTYSSKNGLTALHRASMLGYTMVVSTLLLSGADPLAKVKPDEFTPFLYACEKGHDAVINTILQLKPDLVPRVIEDTTRDGKTGLYYASRKGSKSAVSALLHHGADSNKAGKDGSTPLMAASYKGFKDIVELLLKYKAQVNDRHKKGTTALYLASDKGHTEVVRILLENGADPNLTEFGSAKWSPLMVACSKGHTNIVQLLLQHKPEVDHQGVDGKTALHIASMYNYGEIVKALVEAKANITLTTRKGQTARDLAVSKGYHKIIDMLSADHKH